MRHAQDSRGQEARRRTHKMEMADGVSEKVGAAETRHTEPGNEPVDEAMSPTIPECTQSG